MHDVSIEANVVCHQTNAVNLFSLKSMVLPLFNVAVWC